MLGPIKAAFKSLKAAIQAAGEDRLRFVDTTIGQEAVAPTDLAGDIEQKLERETASSRQAALSFDILPHALKIAFVARTEPGEMVAIDLMRPFRYSKDRKSVV